jgi:hypothetical protein
MRDMSTGLRSSAARPLPKWVGRSAVIVGASVGLGLFLYQVATSVAAATALLTSLGATVLTMGCIGLAARLWRGDPVEKVSAAGIGDVQVADATTKGFEDVKEVLRQLEDLNERVYALEQPTPD